MKIKIFVIFASKTPIKNTANKVATRSGGFKIIKKSDFFTGRGIPKAIQASEKSATDPTPSAIDEARIDYLLEE